MKVLLLISFSFAVAIAIVCAQMTPTPTPFLNPVPVIVSQAQIPVPVSFSVPIPIIGGWIFTIGAILTAVGLIWRFLIKVSRLITNINQYGSVMLDIAKEFKANEGSTLRDAIDRIEQAVKEAKATAETARIAAEELRGLIKK